METVADTYGTAVEQEEKRSNVSYEYDAWLAPIRDLYPLTDHTPVIATIDEYPVPQALGDNRKDIPIGREFAARFLCIVAGDLITTAYCDNRVEEVSPDLFERLYATPDGQPEPAAATVTSSALGIAHPEIDYADEILLGDALTDFAALFSHLRFVWAVNPTAAISCYYEILQDGHSVFGDGRIPDKAGTWEAALAEAFAAAVLSRKSRPIGGLGDYSFVRGDRVLDAAGYPPEDGLFQELARVSVENVDLGEIHYESTKDTLRTHLSL